MALGDELVTKQIEVMLDMQIKKLQKELTAVREELKATREELSAQIKKLGRDAPQVPPTQYQGQFAPGQAPVSAQPPQGAFTAPQNVAPVPQQAPVQNAPSAQPIDRNGVAPADVSIEKFFYVGGK